MIKEAWPRVNELWNLEFTAASQEQRPCNQLTVWKDFVKSHFSEFPHMCQLIKVMVATPGNTSPLERSYTKLEIVAAKRRNHFKPENLEVLYLLAALSDELPVRNAQDYNMEIKRLEYK
jgi:hypothetical protein